MGIEPRANKGKEIILMNKYEWKGSYMWEEQIARELCVARRNRECIACGQSE